MSRRKQDVFEELLLEVRRSQNATDRFDQAVADAIGLNRTDMRCLDIVQMEGSVTAGRLAERSGLTTGAITTVIDRLEQRGLARRVRDPRDRRRVLVEVAPEATQGATNFYGGHMALAERMYRRYSQEQLELLLEFIREGREFNEQAAAQLEERTRSERAEQSAPRAQQSGPRAEQSGP
jgi:DNA-binding MarR family transcriptional regulator